MREMEADNYIFVQYPMTVVSTLSTKTMKSSSPVSVERVKPKVIFPVCGSRLSRFLVSG